MTDGVLDERDGPVLTVTIDRPHARNALTVAASRRLRVIFEDFRDDPALWVAILTGAGGEAFCAGADLKEGASMSSETLRALMAEPPPFGGITRNFDAAKPIIAAVEGVALGGGTELALASDIVVAGESATFGLPEPRVGRVAAAGGMHRLVRQLPLKPAMGMLLTGSRITAREAWRLGLVNEVVASGGALDAARRWAAEVLACSPLAVRLVKEAVTEGLLAPTTDAAMAADAGRMERLRGSQDFREGARAFVEKRPPSWSGR